MREMGLIAAFGAATLLLGCATVTRGSDEPVAFDSVPSGAEMHSSIVSLCAIAGTCPTEDQLTREVDPANTKPGPACVTPCTVQLKRSDDLIITFSKPGYQPQTVRVIRKVSGGGAAGFAGNAIVGGAVGVAVDGVTGAATDHFPNPVKVTLVAIAAPPAPAGPKKKIKEQKTSAAAITH